MSKDYPASESKLVQLREKGIFAKSIYLQKAFRFLSFILLLFILMPAFIKVLDFKEFFLHLESMSFQNFINLYRKIIFVPLLFLTVSFVLNLIFTRFFFAPALAKPDFSRIRYFNNRQLNFSNIFYHFVMISVFLITVIYVFYHSTSDFFVSGVSFEKNKASLFRTNIIYLVLYLVLGLISYLLNWLFFRKSQMMTREEVDAENREQQSKFRR